MAKHVKNALEIEASCAFRDAGGQGGSDGYSAIRRWTGCPVDLLPPCEDGVAKNGDLDRRGEPEARGKGMGLYDAVTCDGVPVAIKGSGSGNGYGNTDVTMYHEAVIWCAEAGIPQWVMLLRGEADCMEMRRINLSDVVLAWQVGTLPEDTIVVRSDKRAWTSAKASKIAQRSVRNPETGRWENETDYPRLRVLWSKVASLRGDLFWDGDFVPFKAEVPIPWGLRKRK